MAADGSFALRADDLTEGKSRKFVLRSGDRELDCFAVRFRGEVRAYVNECRHVAMSLDWVDNQFFTEDGEFLLCPTHGALYTPDTGECVSGPPCGKSLFPVELVDREGDLYALWPESFPR